MVLSSVNRRLSGARSACCLCLGLGLAACGGGGGDLISTGTGTTTTTTTTGTGTGTTTGTTSTTSPGGLYTGTISSALQGGTFSVVGAVGEAGATELFSTTTNRQYSMSLSLSGTTATGTLSAYNFDGTLLGSGPFSGTLAPRSQLSGSYTLANGDNGTLALTYSAQYTQPQALATAAGSYLWTSTRNNGASTLTLGADGTLSGTTEAGCAFTGSAVVPDARYDLLTTTLNYANTSACGAGAGRQLTGLAWYTPAAASGTGRDALTSAATSDQVGIFALYQRQ